MVKVSCCQARVVSEWQESGEMTCHFSGKFPWLIFSRVEILQVVSMFPLHATDSPSSVLASATHLQHIKMETCLRYAEGVRSYIDSLTIRQAIRFFFLFPCSRPFALTDSPLSQVFDSLTTTPLSLANMIGGSVIIFQSRRCLGTSLSCTCVPFFPLLYYLLLTHPVALLPRADPHLCPHVIFGPRPAWDDVCAGFKSERADASGKVQIHAVGCSFVRRGAGTQGLRECRVAAAAPCMCACGGSGM